MEFEFYYIKFKFNACSFKNTHLADGNIFLSSCALFFRWRSTSSFLVLVPTIRIPMASVILKRFIQIWRPLVRQSDLFQRKQLISRIRYQIFRRFLDWIVSQRFVGIRIFIRIVCIRCVGRGDKIFVVVKVGTLFVVNCK